MTDPTATPATPATLRALLERVRNATGADYDLEWDIIQAFEAPLDALRMSTPHITASVDAAFALIERVLPGAFWSVSNAARKPRASVWVPSPLRAYSTRHQSAETPALALLAALLEAKIVEAENDA